MRRVLILLFSVCSLFASAQHADTAVWAFPVCNVARLYAANFGEMRPGHFHAGIDIKTDGVEGKPVVAVSNGYISRIAVAPSGYGRAIYITLDNGTTAVYGHLQRFRDDLEKYVREERYRRRANSVDLQFGPGIWPVKRGEVIACSGNSGSSMGPHLHFELRNTHTQRRLNIVREGIVRPKDDLPPRILKIHYVEADTLPDGVCLRSAPVEYPVVRSADGRYRLTREGAVPVGPKGYFVAEVTDRRNGVNNTFGIWRVTAYLDEDPYFEYRIDGFRAGHSRFCDAVSCYPLQIASRNEAIRLAQLSEAPEYFYPVMRERGLVRTAQGQTRRIRIEAEDDCGNQSSLSFDILGQASELRPQTDSSAVALYPGRAATLRSGREMTVHIPAGTLYEPLYYRPARSEVSRNCPGVVVLSPAYKVLEPTTPLHTPITVTIRAEIPQSLQLRAVLASVRPDGRLSLVGGTCNNSAVTASTHSTGLLAIVADTLPPRVTPLFKEGDNLSQAASLRFKVSDNFSGISSCELLIDNRWAPGDRFPVQGTLIHTFDTPAAGCRHHVRLTISDACGNRTRWNGTFYR